MAGADLAFLGINEQSELDSMLLRLLFRSSPALTWDVDDAPLSLEDTLVFDLEDVILFSFRTLDMLMKRKINFKEGK